MSTHADVSDEASEREEKERELGIAAVRRRASEVRDVDDDSEDCANDCGEVRSRPSRYCSLECRDEHDRRATIRRKQGLLAR